MDLKVLEQQMEELMSSDPASFSDAGSIVTLERLFARFEAFTTAAVANFDTSGEWASDGARNAAGWVATRCRLPMAQARRQVRRGRDLRHLPDCAQAWEDGEITSAHVDKIASLRSPATEDALARDESMLVEQARTMRYEPFSRACDYWEQLADPDGAETDADKQVARRDVYLASSFDGMWLGHITLDPVSGAIVADELGRLEGEMFEADWAAARAELGHDPTIGDLARTPGQRRADALVEMARRSKTAPADGRRPAPLFSVLIDFETLAGRVCELAQGMVVSPGTLVPWLDRAYFERVVFGPQARIEVSATARLFTGATRRAIQLRDRQCTHPYCDQSATHCDVDHILPYTAGGPTTQENGRLLCSYHNLLRNHQLPTRTGFEPSREGDSNRLAEGESAPPSEGGPDPPPVQLE